MAVMIIVSCCHHCYTSFSIYLI